MREHLHDVPMRTITAGLLPLLPALLYAMNVLLARMPGLSNPLEELWLEILSSRMSLPILICLLLVLPFGVVVYGILILLKQRHYITGGLVITAGTAIFFFNLLARSI